MSLNKAQPDSNAPDGGASRPESQGAGVGMLGYSVVQAPAGMKPAQSNADIGNTADFSVAANEGTSLPSYDEQSESPSAETGG